MINSFLNNTKKIENNIKHSNTNCICHREIRNNNRKNDTYIIRNDRQKNEYNNHRFNRNNRKEDNKITNSSEINTILHKWDLYKSDSRTKKEEENKDNNIRFSFKTKNHNFHNISTAYHSFDKDGKKYGRNTYEIKNINHIKIIETEINTPRINGKTKNFVYQKNSNDLSKTLIIFNNRDNCGYHEIKDVKKNNLNQNNNNNNTEKKNENKNLLKYLSINNNKNNNNNNSFKRSLILNNNNNNNSIINNNNNKNFNTKKNEVNNNPNEINKNGNKRKYSYYNFKTVKNSFNPQKKLINEENNNFFSYRNINNIPKNNKNETNKNNDNKNLNKSLIFRKIYINNTPEQKKYHNLQGSRASFVKRNDLKNNNSYFNNIVNDKNIMNSNRFLSGNLKEMINDMKNENDSYKISNYENKLNKSKIPNIRINKKFSPTKKYNSSLITHLKQNSYANYNSNSKEKKIQNEKYEINHIFKNVEKNETNEINSNNKNKNQKEIQNSHRHIEKILKSDSKVKNNDSLILIKNQSFKRVKERENNNKEEGNEKSNLNDIKMKLKYGNNYVNNNVKKFDKNNILHQINNENINNSNKKSNHKYNNPFNRQNNKRKDLTDDKIKYKYMIKKKCRSIEKNESKNKKTKSSIEMVKKHRSRTKTKSKAKKHSKQVKYLDKLKIFKFSETNYNLNNESSTNCSKDNDYRYKKLIIQHNKSHSKKKKNINSFNLNYKTFEEDFKINDTNINEKYRKLKPQISVRITLSKKNNVNIVGILRYFKVNYFCSENLRNKYDFDSEDTSEFYNAKF